MTYRILTVRLLQSLIDVLEPRRRLLTGTARLSWISYIRIIGQLVAARNPPSILNYPLALWLSAGGNSLAIVIFNLVEGYKIWMRLLHMVLLVCFVWVCPRLVRWEILRAAQVGCARGGNDPCGLRVLEAQLAHLLHLGLNRKSNPCLRCNHPWWVRHVDVAIVPSTHEIITCNPKIDQALLVFLLFLLGRHYYSVLLIYILAVFGRWRINKPL